MVLQLHPHLARRCGGVQTEVWVVALMLIPLGYPFGVRVEDVLRTNCVVMSRRLTLQVPGLVLV